jgi:hypothetical protein
LCWLLGHSSTSPSVKSGGHADKVPLKLSRGQA